MRNLLFLLFISVAPLALKAQSPLGTGNTQANFGLGIDGDGIPIYGGLDYGLSNDVTLGGVAGISKHYFSLGGNINYHFDRLFALPSYWNIYAGANAGFFFDLNDNNKREGFGLGAQIGSRYFFNDKWGINLELGGGNQVSGGKLGATIKF